MAVSDKEHVVFPGREVGLLSIRITVAGRFQSHPIMETFLTSAFPKRLIMLDKYRRIELRKRTFSAPR